MVQLAFRNKYLIIVLSLFIAVVSIVTIQRLPVDILPNYKTSAVQVLTLYPGMPAQVMESDITNRIERWTGQSNGISRQESKSLIGVSIVKDYFGEDVDPNTALSQVTSLAMSDLYYLPPGTVPPMVMPYDPTATTPLALLAVSSDSLSEKELYDVAYFQLRNLLGSVEGIIAPAVFGGKLRRIYMYVYPEKLQSYHLSQTDVMDAVQRNNLMIPTGDVNIGNLNYSVNANGMLPAVDDFNNIVIKMSADGAPVFLKDIGYAKDASAIQTNMVHINGRRQVYIPIYKRTGANTIASVEAVKTKLKELKARLPKSLNLEVILDQSTYVRHSIGGLLKEGAWGLLFVSLALFLTLGSLRSTVTAALSIPLSALFAFIGLYFAGYTINSMTLGGIALAIGLLVDDSIVVLENIDRHVRMGKTRTAAALDGTIEVAMPVLATALTIIIVFLPVIFLTGISKYLFTPLAVTVSLAMIGSRLISMTLVPIMAAAGVPLPESRLQQSHRSTWFQRKINGLTETYGRRLSKLVAPRAKMTRFGMITVVLALLAVSAWALLGKGNHAIGTELFPKMDVGQISIDVRMESGTRIEKAEETVSDIEKYLQKQLGADVNTVVSNIGVLNDWPAAYTPNSGTQDATISIQLKEGHSTRTQDDVSLLRGELRHRFPGVQFVFNTGGIVTTALNFGLPSPIDIQVTGNNLQKAHEWAERVRGAVQQVNGAVDVRIQQRYDHPEIAVNIDRTKAALLGVTADDVVKNTVSALNSSVNFKPSFWIDGNNGNHYFVGVTYAEKDLDDPQAVDNISITGQGGRNTLLRNVANTSIKSAPVEINHLNIQRVTDVFANVEGRDIGSVADEIEAKLQPIRKELPEGYSITMRGEVQSMKEGFGHLGLGLVLAVLMVYLVIVPLLRSFTLPLIIVSVIPLALIGVTAMLFFTHTYLNIQSMMGIIMTVGIAVSYSNLLVDKMNTLLKQGMPLTQAIIEGATTRFRPIIMTAVVAVLALLPMAVGYETGSEANVPLARAIIGGVLAAALLSLFVVPVLFYLFNKKYHLNMRPVLMLIAIPLMLSLLSSCNADEQAPARQKAASTNIPLVAVAQPETHRFDSPLQIPGTADPYQVTRLFAMTNGFLSRLNVDIGDFVKEGQVVAVLENPALLRDKEKLDAELRGKQSIYLRLKSIYEKTPELTTIAEVERTQADYETVNAQLRALLLDISYLNVRAPFSGVITRRFVDKGAVVQNGLSASNATPLFELQDVQRMRLTVDVPEAEAVLVNKGTQAIVTFPELPGAAYTGVVSRLSVGLDNATRTMRVEIDLPNAGLRIRSGMYATVQLQRKGHHDVLSVPNEAIGNAKGQSFVYVVREGIVKKIDVKTGLRDRAFAELLSGDVSAADQVVVKGKEFCVDGITVQTKTVNSNK